MGVFVLVEEIILRINLILMMMRVFKADKGKGSSYILILSFAITPDIVKIQIIKNVSSSTSLKKL